MPCPVWLCLDSEPIGSVLRFLGLDRRAHTCAQVGNVEINIVVNDADND